MAERPAKTLGLFVTATDTGVGKTYITALIAGELRAAGVRVGAYKPVCSGADVAANGAISWGDVITLTQAIGGDVDEFRICPQRFKAPLAPNVAASLEGRRVDSVQLREGTRWWEGRVDVLLVEGVGGLLCPLTESETIADLAVDLGYPLFVVARLGLGTINHTLLTVEAAQRRGLHVAGIILNEAEPLPDSSHFEENLAEIARRTNVPVLGVVRHGRSCVEPWKGWQARANWLALIEVASRSGRSD